MLGKGVKCVLVTRKGSVIEANIHGMTADEAHNELVKLIERADSGVAEIHVIHGYRRGDVLKSMVQQKLHHPRISYKCQSLLNEGETKIYLKKR